MQQNKDDAVQSTSLSGDVDVPLSMHFCFVLQRVNRVITRQLNSILHMINLTTAQLMILEVVAANKSLRQKDLAELLEKDHATVTANLGWLVRRDLITRCQDQTDRRAQRLSLTPDGMFLLTRARELVTGFEANLGLNAAGENVLNELFNALESLSSRPVEGAEPRLGNRSV